MVTEYTATGSPSPPPAPHSVMFTPLNAYNVNMNYITIVNIGWIVFMVYWAISALSTKRAARSSRWTAGLIFRVVLAACVILALHYSHHGRMLRKALVLMNPADATVGVLLFLAGVGVAVWARVYLGRNWGMPMSLREGHELVTSGPYRYVRHPIYSGFVLAMVGTIMTGDIYWLVVLPITLIYFIYSGLSEEKTMTEQFPNEYPEYKKHTKMLIPFAL